MKSKYVPPHLTGKGLYNYLVKNEALIFHAKKSEIKKADGCYASPYYINAKGDLTTKAEVTDTQIDPTRLKVVVVINATNWYDSHGDVHIPGLWKKSLSDNKKVGFYLLKQHQRGFEDIIAENCSGFTKQLSWKELNLNIPGVTEALIFDGIVEEQRNEYMFGQYQKGYVKKHSVGMRYIKLLTCINDDDYPVQKENWDKYIEMVANRDEAEAEGYFWAILEAQVIEGSAVVFASNCMTPTIEASIMGIKNTYKSESSDNANIDFIDMMIPHHEAAIKMVDEYQGRVDNQDLIGIMTNIKTSQQAEIDKMNAIKAVEQAKAILNTGTKKEPLLSTSEEPPFDVLAAIKATKFI